MQLFRALLEDLPARDAAELERIVTQMAAARSRRVLESGWTTRGPARERQPAQDSIDKSV